MLQEGQKAPEFSLPDQNGKNVSLSQFRGHKVILYFYPKDNTPGCTREACAFKSAFDAFRRNDIIVIGISKDSIASHQKFIEKYELPFVLLSDTELETINAYDVWKEKKLYGKTAFGVVRSTYVIDENGFIKKVYEKASPDTNAKDILDYLKLLL
jgi:peroxiredoxin Q/BCP